MRGLRQGPAPSRVGRRQVIAFLPAEKVDAFRSWSRQRGAPLQKSLADAINLSLRDLGIDPILAVEKHRHFVRVQRAACVRTDTSGPRARAGRKALSGWYDRLAVVRLTDITSELGLTIQALAERGVDHLLSRAPASDLISLPAQAPDGGAYPAGAMPDLFQDALVLDGS